jgi:hypothetical protein
VDADGDGDVDVVASSYTADSVTLHINNGARPPAWTTVVATATADFVRAASPASASTPLSHHHSHVNAQKLPPPSCVLRDVRSSLHTPLMLTGTGTWTL